jgi:two-component system, OmpR family, sensor kinase
MFKVFRSLRWRLQAWHALILAVVVATFGGLLHWEMVLAHWDRVDEELLSAARILEGTMLSVPPSILEAMSKDVGSNEEPRNQPRRPRPRAPLHTRPGPPMRSQVIPSNTFPLREWNKYSTNEIDALRLTDQEWIESIELPTALLEQLGRNDGSAYFAIWDADYRPIKTARLPEQPPVPSSQIVDSVSRNRFARQQRGPFREVFILGPRETLVCVGRPVDHEQGKVHRLTWFMVACGSGVLCVGLVGGWWLGNNAIRPIEQISQTAEKVSGAHLTERVDVAGFDSELAGLGSTLNEMLDRLSDSFESQRQFSADASHELRTPVSVILTTAELALSKPREPDEYREHLQKCHRAADRMRQLTDSLLTLARLDASSNLEMQAVQLNELLDESLASVKPMAEGKSIQWQTTIETCEIQGNAVLLRQAFVNLLSNAIRYSEVSGRIQVRLMSTPDAILFEVCDEGIGISEENQAKIFNRFYRVAQSRSRAEGGSGLGLAIVKRIVECHHGTVTVESELGKGSIFQIRMAPTSRDHRA